MKVLQDIEKKFPEVKEVILFVDTLAPFFANAMKLRQEVEPDDAY